MNSFGTHDFGTWNHQVAVEPDEGLTLEWGTAVARNIAKISKMHVISDSVNGNPEVLDPTRGNFTSIPFNNLLFPTGSIYNEPILYGLYNMSANSAGAADPNDLTEYTNSLYYQNAADHAAIPTFFEPRKRYTELQLFTETSVYDGLSYIILSYGH